jgi:hypothetical protein
VGLHTAQPVTFTSARPGAEVGRVVLSLVGAAALVVGAFLNWTRGVVGTDLTYRAFVNTDFSTRSDIVKTAGGIVILFGLVAVVGLVDRTGWLSRLAGALGVVAFVLFAIEVYRSPVPHSMQIGAWMVLGGGIVLLLAGMFGPHQVVEAPTVVEEERRI